MSDTNDIALSVRNLKTFFYTNNRCNKAVNGVSFDVKKGKTLCIVGESGCGKSVTAATIMQLLPTLSRIEEGEIIFQKDDKKINIEKLEKNGKEMRSIRGSDIAMIFQDPMTALNPVYTVGFQISENLKYHTNLNKKQIREKCISLLSDMGIPLPEKRVDEYPHSYSGGMRQRAMIAMAMACNPKILIADEPTTALDVTVEKALLELLTDLQKDFNMSILFITHDLNIVKKFSDEVCVMKEGEIVEAGSVNEIFSNPSHSYTKKLLDSIPGKKETLNEEGKILLDAGQVNINYVVARNLFGKPKEFLNAVKKVDIKIYKGSTAGLVGESGSGKSSLARALLGIEDAEGSIKFDGIDITCLDQKSIRNFKKEFQIVFQDPFGSLSPRMTIGEVIGEGLKVHESEMSKKDRFTKIMSALKDVELEESSFSRFPHELSGGQRQRVAIARAIILRPKLILLDEPTSALDVSIQMQILNLLKDLQIKLGLAYLCISHDLRVIRFLSDQVYVMKDGVIVEYGSSEEVFEMPKHEYTKELLAASIA